MKHSQRKDGNFEEELDNKLSQLFHRKPQKSINSSHKKIQKKTPLQINEYSKISIGSPIKQEIRKSIVYDDQSSKNSSPIQKSIKFEDASIFSTVTSKDLESFLRTHFDPKILQLHLKKFINKMIEICSLDPSTQYLEILYEELEKQLTTTDSNIISLNALEIVLRKRGVSPTVYFEEKYHKCKYELKKKQLKNDYENKKKSIKEISYGLEERQKQINNMISNLKSREEQILKREKKINGREKQVHQRYKSLKKILQDSAFKLEEQYRNRINELINKFERKANTFERNLKYKLEALDRKINEIHRLREFKEMEIKASLKEDLQESRKQQQTVRKKKQQKQLKELQTQIQQNHEENNSLEEDNKKLMRLCGGLENKVTKLEKKGKKLESQIEKYQMKIKQLQFLCEEKDHAFEQLNNKLNDFYALQAKQKGQLSGRKNSKIRNPEVYDVVSVYENSISGEHSAKSFIETAQLINSLITSHFDCKSLVSRTLEKTVLRIIQLKNKQMNSILQEEIVDGFLNEISKSKLMSYKKIQKIPSLQTKIQLILLYLLICPKENLTQYNTVLIDLVEKEGVLQEISQEIVQNKMILALIFRLLKDERIEGTSFLSDFILAMNLVSDKEKCSVFLEFNIHKFIFQELLIYGINGQSKGEILEVVEKLSIIVQRLFYHHKIVLNGEEIQVLQEMKSKYADKSTIIAPNIENIISLINQH